jgi:cell shape-determining protein MreC
MHNDVAEYMQRLEAENKRLHFELQQHHDQSKYVVKKLEAENAKLKEAAKAHLHTIDTLAALLEAKR